MDLDIARNPLASTKSLYDLIQKYDGSDRFLGEALLLNPSLTAEMLTLLLAKCSHDLGILAIKHPALGIEDQIKMILLIEDDKLRVKAKLILLEREFLNPDVLLVLSLDPNSDVRTKAQEMLKDDTNSCDRER